MNILAPRQTRRVNLNDRPNHYELPLGAQARDLVEQLYVEPLVYHAEEAEARARNLKLVCGLVAHAARAAEVLRVDARRERVDARVAVALRLVQALPARED